MAAGLGTRFGGLKQLHPVFNTFAIIDFSIYDAIKAGFNEIILIIREETQEEFNKHFSKFQNNKIEIRFVYQTSNNELSNIIRTKPWGTGHALLALEPVITNPFALINADDFYGRDAFKSMHDALYSNKTHQGYLIGYKICNTLSENGSVSRGECFLDSDNNLKQIIERHNIRQTDNSISYDENSIMDSNTIVSMNFWGFSPDVFSIGITLFKKFIETTTYKSSDEFYITSIIERAVHSKEFDFKVLKNLSKWYGITYKNDEKQVHNHLQILIESNHYPTDLW